jgi:RimJ/RimL family protein N-acetyltransferase
MSAADSRTRPAADIAARRSTAPARPHRPVRLPDPPLADTRAGIVLRPWAVTPEDVASLVAAWSDPLLAAADGVPDEASAARAACWIRGDARRRAAGACLDLVIAPCSAGGSISGAGGSVPRPVVGAGGPVSGPSVPGSAVLGEVGLRSIDQERRRAEVSWWVAPAHRGRGVATAAARLLASWALSPAGGLDQVWARIDPANGSSARVAASAGLVELGSAGGTTVWSRTRAATPPRPA